MPSMLMAMSVLCLIGCVISAGVGVVAGFRALANRRAGVSLFDPFVYWKLTPDGDRHRRRERWSIVVFLAFAGLAVLFDRAARL